MTFTSGKCAHCGKDIHNGIRLFFCEECSAAYLKEQIQQAVSGMNKTVKKVCEEIANDRKRRTDSGV